MEHSDELLQWLYETYYERLLRAAYRMVGCVELARDLVQDVFLFALFHSDKLRDHPAPEGWLMLTLRNFVQNERRRSDKYSMVSLEAVGEFPGKTPELPLELFLPKGLSEAERTVLIWRFERRMEYREMADLLGISETGCRSRVSRAIERCGKLLREK